MMYDILPVQFIQFIKTIIEWCNNNNGFLFAVLTIGYIIATLFIYKANEKSANAMKSTNDLQNKIQKQNIDIQLFEKRMDVYFKIKEYYFQDVANKWENKISGNDNKIPEIDKKLLFEIKYLFDVNIFNQLILIIEYFYDISKKIDIFYYAYKELEKKDGISIPNVIKLRNDYIEKYKKLSETEEKDFIEFAKNNIQKFTYKNDEVEVNFYNNLVDIKKSQNYFFSTLVAKLIMNIEKEMPINSFKGIK